jgi:hypothetical protein
VLIVLGDVWKGGKQNKIAMLFGFFVLKASVLQERRGFGIGVARQWWWWSLWRKWKSNWFPSWDKAFAALRIVG